LFYLDNSVEKQKVLDELNYIYKTSVLPVEQAYKYSSFGVGSVTGVYSLSRLFGQKQQQIEKKKLALSLSFIENCIFH
jgi:N-terminal EH-domain containing protein